MKIALIVEDQSLQDYLVLVLLGEDYEVKVYPSQNEALMNLEKDPPDLLISEYQNTNINGLDICKVLRKNFLFRYVPIIFILSESELLNKARLTYAGADDYITRSLLENELLLKVKLNLYRIARQQDINPLTKLPGQSSLWKEIQRRIEAKTLFSVCYADVFRFKEYNQRYGFKRGDDVIQYVGALILKTLKNYGSPSDFLAHPQDDDFIFLCLTDAADAISEKIVKEFDETIAQFYDEEDRQKKMITLKNRKGEIEKIPFTRISIGVVTNESYQFINPAQTIQISSELKDFAKSNFDKSMFIKERRKSYPFY